MFKKIHHLGLLMAMSFVANAHAQHYRIDPGSTYTFLPSGESAWDYPCEPSLFRCDFAVSGTFHIAIQKSAMTFMDLDLQLDGNEALQTHATWPINAETAERFLESIGEPGYDRDLLLREPGVYELDESTTIFNQPLRVEISGDSLQISGGIDWTPVDGDGQLFNVSATMVPEPSHGIPFVGLAVLFVARVHRTRKETY